MHKGKQKVFKRCPKLFILLEALDRLTVAMLQKQNNTYHNNFYLFHKFEFFMIETYTVFLHGQLAFEILKFISIFTNLHEFTNFKIQIIY